MKKYDFIGEFKNGFAQVEINNKWGFVNTDGEEIIPPKYNFVSDFCEGLARVQLSTEYKSTPSKYIFIHDLEEDFTEAQFNNKWGVVNQDGKEVVPPKYDFVHDFQEGFAKVELNGRWGFINQQGQEIVAPKYDCVYDFQEDFAEVKLFCETRGFVNKDGEEFLFIEGKEIGSENRNLYYQRYKDTIVFSTGCFIGDKETFIKVIKETHGNNDYAKEYLTYIKEIEKELFM